MNALSKLIPFRVARKGMATPSPSADRLAAISLQTLNAINEAIGDGGANPAVDPSPRPAAASDLSGLIQRRSPQRFDPEAANTADMADHKSAEASMVSRTEAPQTEPRPAPFFTIVPVPQNRPETSPPETNWPRRQLTVRLKRDKSEALDQLAKQSGRTYQDILSKAIGDYLNR
ncbi:MAG: hypothetical protein HOM25_21915 [Rhodospirillaceae bacterium]|nr:hypothetical protein [Rhodospirillaceae bacterium]MBT5811823.1 hypothetical protein [Rhodospirillaceae bacterium]